MLLLKVGNYMVFRKINTLKYARYYHKCASSYDRQMEEHTHPVFSPELENLNQKLDRFSKTPKTLNDEEIERFLTSLDKLFNIRKEHHINTPERIEETENPFLDNERIQSIPTDLDELLF